MYETMMNFYKVIYSERSLNPMAAKIVAEETDKNLLDDYLKWFCEENGTLQTISGDDR